MKSTIEYLLKVFNSSFVIENTELADYPMYFRKKYICQFAAIDSNSVALIEHAEKPKLIIESLKKELLQIRKLTGRMPVFVFNVLRLSQRNHLVQSRIPFIVPDTQIYLPNIVVNLTEQENQEKYYNRKFVKSTQVSFAYLLLNPMDEINGPKLAAALGFSTNTANRVLNELADRGILYKEGNGTRKRFVMPDKRTYWNAGKAYLFNPITNAFPLAKNKVNIESGLLYKSYETALYKLSEDFDEDSLPIVSYACASNKLGLTTNDNKPVLSTMSYKDLVNIQCLAYDPALLTNTDTVDIVTLYAQLSEQNDERIQIALDALLEEVLND